MLNALARKLKERVTRRDPDFVIGNPRDPYMRRWWVVPRNRWFNLYLHHFLHSDDDRALHDHPWWNLSYIISGSYTEHTIAAGGVNHRSVRSAGQMRFRGAKTAHRVELHAGPCWTLFVTGPTLRTWGFHCPRGWVPWKEFVKPTAHGQAGRGCGEID